MNQYGKAYRVFSYRGETYLGSDGDKQRPVDYIFSKFGTDDFKNISVLDLGCAGGGLLFYLLERGAAKAVGVERDMKRAQVAIDIKNRFKISNLTIFIEEIESYLARAHEQFDFLLLLNVLHHSPDPLKIISLVAELAPCRIILELPNKRFYTPYSKDKEKMRRFILPMSRNRIIEEFKARDFELEFEFNSDEEALFPGGRRHIYVLKKNSVKKIQLSHVNEETDYLIIGPGTSGKTTLMRSLTGYPIEKSLSMHKPRNKSFFLALFRSKFSELPRIAYLPPTWKSAKISLRFRSFTWNIQDWANFASDHERNIIVCYAEKSQRLDRLRVRMNNNYLKNFETDQINRILAILVSSESSFRMQIELIKLVGVLKFFTIRRVIREEFFANYEFSYQQLFFLLRKKGLNFQAYESNS